MKRIHVVASLFIGEQSFRRFAFIAKIIKVKLIANILNL